MSSSSRATATRISSGPPTLFSLRLFLVFLLAVILLMFMGLWWVGVGLEDGQGLAACLAVILAFATLGEFVRRGFRVSLKGMLIGITVFAVLLGMLSQHLLEARKRGRIVERLQMLGARVQYDYQYTGDEWLTLRDGLNVPMWVRDLVGDDVFARVTMIDLDGNRCRDADLADIGGLPSLREVRLSHSAVTDRGILALAGLPNLDSITLNGIQATEAGLKALGECPRLEGLQFYGPHVTDETLRHLKHIPGLRKLLLYDTNITEDGLRHLAALKELESIKLNSRRINQLNERGGIRLKSLSSLRTLILGRTGVSDAGIEELQDMQHLTYISFSGTAVSAAAINRLRAAMPDTDIQKW